NNKPQVLAGLARHAGNERARISSETGVPAGTVKLHISRMRNQGEFPRREFKRPKIEEMFRNGKRPPEVLEQVRGSKSTVKAYWIDFLKRFPEFRKKNKREQIMDLFKEPENVIRFCDDPVETIIWLSRRFSLPIVHVQKPLSKLIELGVLPAPLTEEERLLEYFSTDPRPTNKGAARLLKRDIDSLRKVINAPSLVNLRNSPQQKEAAMERIRNKKEAIQAFRFQNAQKARLMPAHTRAEHEMKKIAIGLLAYRESGNQQEFAENRAALMKIHAGTGLSELLDTVFPRNHFGNRTLFEAGLTQVKRIFSQQFHPVIEKLFELEEIRKNAPAQEKRRTKGFSLQIK
ncbi:MAG: hypothetical protein HY917_04395, partial [Candidatus Diapherotrites archaeon]|nr:hypothetical protein [Candidatus Diapherotrites archaeon]